MIKVYKDFYYNVADMNRAIDFYSKALGLEKTFGDEHWTAMSVGNLNLGLHSSDGQSIPTTPRDSHGQSCGGTLTLQSDDIASDRQAIVRAGGRILGEADEPWGHMLVFEDLDGNVS